MGLSDDILGLVVAHFPDKSFLNMALISKSYYEVCYPVLLLNSLNKHDGVTKGSVRHLLSDDGSCVLVHAIDYSDVDLFDQCLRAMGFWSSERNEAGKLTPIDKSRYTKLLLQCLYAGSLQCLVHLEAQNPSLFEDQLRERYREVKEVLRTCHHYHFLTFFAKLDQSKMKTEIKRSIKQGKLVLGNEGGRPQLLWSSWARRDPVTLKRAVIDTNSVNSQIYELKLGSDVFSAQMAVIFRQLIGENANRLHISPERTMLTFRGAFYKQCARMDTSAALIEAIVKEGKLDVNALRRPNEWYEASCESNLWWLRTKYSHDKGHFFTAIDIAAKFYNITALRVLLRLGADGGGGRSIAKRQGLLHDGQQTPPVLYHVFNQAIKEVCFGCPWANHTKYYYRKGVCRCSYRPRSLRRTVISWFQELSALCGRVETMTRILLEHEPHHRDLYSSGGEMSALHPLNELLTLTGKILNEITELGQHTRRWNVYAHLDPQRWDFKRFIEGLGKAYDLILASDPALQTVNALQPPSNKTGVRRLPEIAGWKEVSPLQVSFAELIQRDAEYENGTGYNYSDGGFVSSEEEYSSSEDDSASSEDESISSEDESTSSEDEYSSSEE
ncbi:hypothetical protein F5Y16DRAFT_393546 [Xylariaceae sp. FL0255]|nr:hypothetical protein F5Y16DRAFT_393546 [Xylariaceae sp. FL0255]